MLKFRVLPRLVVVNMVDDIQFPLALSISQGSLKNQDFQNRVLCVTKPGFLIVIFLASAAFCPTNVAKTWEKVDKSPGFSKMTMTKTMT